MKKNERIKLILEGDLTRVIAILAFPIFLSDLIQRGYAIVDLFFLGKLGAGPLAAITFLEPLQAGIIAIAGGVCMAASSIISRNVGGGRYKRAKVNLGNILVISLFFAVVISLTGAFFTREFLELINTSSEIIDECYDYLSLILVGAPFTFLNMIYIAVRQAEGDTKKPLIMSGISLGLNALLNPIFIFHLGMGIRGAALTTVLSRVVLGLYIVYDLFNSRRQLTLELSNFVVKKSIARSILTIAAPATMSRIVYSVGKMILYSYCVKYGAPAMAVFGSGIMIQDTMFLVNRSIGSANMVVLGQNIGNKNYARVRESLSKATKAALGIALTGVTILVAFPYFIGGLIVKERAILDGIALFFRTTSYTHILFGLCTIYEGFFVATGDSKFIMKVNMLKFWLLRIGLLLILDRFTNLGQYSVWIALNVSNSIILPVYIIKYKKVMEKIEGSLSKKQTELV